MNSGISTPKFEQYFKGCHKLGGLVEICVKMCKRLLNSSIKNNVLTLREFEFFVEECIHLINRRPVAIKESLRDCDGETIPQTITPEQLIHGHKLNSVNIIPSLHPTFQSDFQNDPEFDPLNFIRKLEIKLSKVRKNLNEVYHDEFIYHLLDQSIDKDDRYKKLRHVPLQPGDIVLIKEEYLKPNKYEMARVKSVIFNDLGESTNVVLIKGNRKIVKYHVSSIIPLLRSSEYTDVSFPTETEPADLVSANAKCH